MPAESSPEPFVSGGTVEAITELFDRAGRAAQSQRHSHPREDHKTAALVSAILDAASITGLEVVARGTSFAEEDEIGADMEVVIFGPFGPDGKPVTKGVIFQCKRDDGGRLPGGVADLKKPRGPKGDRPSQITALRRNKEASAILVFPDGDQVKAAEVRELPQHPGTRDLRRKLRPLPEVMRDVARCKFGKLDHRPPRDFLAGAVWHFAPSTARWSVSILTPELIAGAGRPRRSR